MDVLVCSRDSLIEIDGDCREERDLFIREKYVKKAFLDRNAVSVELQTPAALGAVRRTDCGLVAAMCLPGGDGVCGSICFHAILGIVRGRCRE